MVTKLRSTWLAGSGALLLVLAISGAAAGATVLTTVTGPTPEVEAEPEVVETDPTVVETDPTVVDTTTTFEDVDGDGIDDDCEEGTVVADPAAAAAAALAVDANGDGAISISEAAQSDRVGGKNCNHGGYVSRAAHERNAAAKAEREAARAAAKAEREAAKAERTAARAKPAKANGH